MFKKPEFPGFRKKKSASASHTKKTTFIKNEGLSLLDDEKPAAVGELWLCRNVLKKGHLTEGLPDCLSIQKRLRLLSSAMMLPSKPRKDLYLNTACSVRSFRPSESFSTLTCILSPSPFLLLVRPRKLTRDEWLGFQCERVPEQAG
jgi:hypothetical protein